MIDLFMSLCNYHILLFTCRRKRSDFQDGMYPPVLVI
jgi:hypothetical protein